MLPATSYLGIGSNLGDRNLNIRKALGYLKDTRGVSIQKCSDLYETKPAGGPKNQPEFLNAAVEIKAILGPFELLKKLKDIEARLGRKKTAKWGPRIIDLDILFFDDLIFNSSLLSIPHPLLYKRYFVLKPLNEIASGFIHPLLGKSIKQLLEQPAASLRLRAKAEAGSNLRRCKRLPAGRQASSLCSSQ